MKRYKSNTTKKRLSTMEWERLSEDRTLGTAYQELATEMQRAYAVAEQKAVRMGGSSAAYLDLSRAVAILDQYPPLINYVRDIAGLDAGQNTFSVAEAPYSRMSPTAPKPGDDQGAPMGWGKQKPEAQGVPNARILRDWADANEWVRAAINVRRQQIGRANIAVMPANERRTYNRGLQKRIQLLLDQPNELRMNYYELMSSLMDDLLVLDRAVVTKAMTVGREPMALYYEDGAQVKIYAEWDGNPNTPRYLYEAPGGTRKVPLYNDEAIVMMANPATYRFGLSPVQVLRNTIQADLTATRSAIEMVDMKPPPQVIQIPGISSTQLEALRIKYEAESAGRKQILFLGGPERAEIKPLVFSARDNQWLEWQQYLARKICAVFQISPQQVGITFDINRATAQSQQEIFEDTGLLPLLLLIEEYFNREVMGDFAPKLPYERSDFTALNLRILFPEITEADRQMHAERAIQMATTGLAGLPSMTLNQVLAMRGEEPVDGGNTFYILNQVTGVIPWLSYDGKSGDYGPRSTGGTLGAQDAGGGPDQEEEVPPPAAGKGDDNAMGFNDTAAPAAAQAGGETAQVVPPFIKTEDVRSSIPFNDIYRNAHRSPGKRWIPGLQQGED